jgi:predicted transcriptional regulator
MRWSAAFVGRDQTFIARIESGSQQPTFVEVEQLASGYGKDLSHFQTIEQIETRNHSFAIRPQALAEYTNALLQKRKRKRQKSSGKLHQRRRA